MTQARTSTPVNGRTDTFHAAAHDIKKTAKQAVKTGKRKTQSLYEEGREKLAEVERNMEVYAQQLTRSVKQNPIASVVVAAGVGYLLSMLLRK